MRHPLILAAALLAATVCAGLDTSLNSLDLAAIAGWVALVFRATSNKEIAS